MATQKQFSNRLIFIILNIVILIELCSTAPTMIPQNLTDLSNIIYNENITKESTTLMNSLSIIEETNLTTEFPSRYNRNTTKPLPVQKSKKQLLTKNLNTKKIKEKNLKYSIRNVATAKLQINNNSVKNKTEMLTVLPPLLTTTDKSILTEDRNLETKVLTKNLNHVNSKINNNNDKAEEIPIVSTLSSLITISPVTVTEKNNLNISYLNKPNDFKVTKDDYITTSIPIQTISIPEKQSGVVEFSTSHTTDELITTESVGTINDNEKVLQNDTTEISIPSTININIQQGLQHNIKMEEFLLTNNSIVISTEIGKNGTDTYSIPILNYTNLNIEEIIPITIAIEITSPSTLVSTSDLITTSTQTNLSNNLISQLTTIEVDKDNVTSLVAPTENPDNNTVIAGTLNSNNSEQIITLDSVVITNKKTEINNESITISTNVEVNINTEKPIEITTITNNQVKNQSGMGHDGVKITKKKQLVEKHFKNDEFVKNSKIDNASSGENINNKKIKKLDIKENSLGPIIMKEEILMTTQTPQENNINKEKSIASTTDTLYVDKENIEEFTTETLEDEQNTTILIPKISQIDSITTDIPGLSTTTENELIKHKNFEKSLISKMEWIPIENIDRSLVNTFDNKTEKLDIIEQSTILPIQLTSSNEHQIKPKIKTNTKFTPTLKTKLKTELDPKSLEIELIESPLILSSDKNIKSVPEFFEIATLKQHPNNNNKETDSAPIEIQINVSEGFGNETENLEFSFRQQPKQQQQQKHIVHHHPPPGFQEIGEITIQRTPDLNTLQPISDYKQKKSNENDEILQVEITAIDNTTKIVDEKQIEMFNDTPKFTVHNEQNLDIRENDDFFVPDLKMDPIDDTGIVSGKNLDNSDRDSVDQDSDTIFYISNTEVKVVESLPTIQNANNHSELNNIRNIKNISQDSNRSKLESQFFPAIYEEDVLIDTPPVVDARNESKIKSFSKEIKLNSQKDDIILSPIKKLLEPLRMNQKDMHDEIILNSAEKSYKSAAATAAAAAPDVSYVGETFIEIEESTSIPNYDFKENRKMSAETHAIIKTTTSTKRDTDLPVMIMDADMNSSGALLSEVIIQPAVVPEMSIGVPVIGELPPQIELKEIDFLPDINNGGGKENHDKLIDAGSIQYGADLIADETELNDNPNRYIFESGYPFTDEKINRVGRVRNNEDIDVLDRDINDDSENDDMMATSQQIVMHAVDNLQREQLIADLPSDSWDDGYKEIPIKRNNPKPNKNIVVIGDNNTNYINNSTNFLNSTGVNGTELLGNATAFSILEENDGTDFNLTDIQTLIIACFATLVPLILSLLTAFGLRYLWIKYRRDHDEGSGLVGDSSTDPLAAKSVAISQDELQTTESGYTLNRSNDTLESNTDITGRTSGTIIDGGGVIVNGVGHDGISQYTNGLGGDVITVSTNQSNGNAMTNKNLSNHCGANGSVTTMTLKNNHLIVETEERNDISRDARETKMHYTSSEKDGVFVVEVARGADSTGAPSGSPHKDLNNHNQKSYNIDIDKIEQQKQQSSTQDECNHEEVQIHQPPTDPNTLIEVDEPIESPFNSEKYKKCSNLGNSNTGLSQSDLSSSSDDSNKAYSYGKQELYTIPMNGGYSPSSLQQKIISPQILEYFEKDGITEKRIPEIETKENNNNNIISNNKDNSESKPFITAALLKQDTINELTSVTSATKQNLKMNCDENKKCNGNTTDKIKSESNNDEIGDAQNFDVHKIVPDDIVDYKKLTQIDEQNRTNYKNGINNADEKISGLDQEIIQQTNPIVIDNNEKNANTNGSKENYDEIENQDNCINGENGFDSIISLPEPPSTEEIKEMNDIILMENSQLDSLPPPPPPLTECQTVTTTAAPAITINTNGNSFSNNIKSIPESIVEEDDNKLMTENENCDDDDDKTILTLSTSKEELHPINELKNGIGGGGTIMTAPLAVTGSS